MKKGIITLIIFITVFILLGFGLSLGYFLGKAEINKLKTEIPLYSLLESKVLMALYGTAYGQVIKITGRDLTLKKNESELTIPIKEDALIEKLIILGENQVAEPQKAEFGDINIGDSVNIIIKINTDGSLQGERVIITSLKPSQG